MMHFVGDAFRRHRKQIARRFESEIDGTGIAIIAAVAVRRHPSRLLRDGSVVTLALFFDIGDTGAEHENQGEAEQRSHAEWLC